MRTAMMRISKLIVLSYIFDWILIILTAVVGYAFYKKAPNRHPFTLDELSISYPYKAQETVSTGLLVVLSLVFPAAVIVIGAFILVPFAAVDKTAPWSVKLRRTLWEWNTGWMGLALALAGAFMATQGLKDLFGRPRPDMLARCDPDLANIAKYAVSGLGQKLPGAPTVVTWRICRNSGEVFNDGFASFPSGHSSFSFAGLTYLTLWICAKLSIAFPYLSTYPLNQGQLQPTSLSSSARQDVPLKNLSQGGITASSHNGTTNTDSTPSTTYSSSHRLSIRSHGAAPPVLQMLIAIFPLGVAAFIAASRWFDYRHHGWDILFGSLLGAFFGWFAFRMYNLPIRRGGGWSWAARSRTHAFVSGLGVPSYTGSERWAEGPITAATGGEVGAGEDAAAGVTSRQTDLEAGHQFPEHDIRPSGQSSSERPFVHEGAAHGHSVEV